MIKSSSKVLFKLDIFFMATSIAVINNQTYKDEILKSYH